MRQTSTDALSAGSMSLDLATEGSDLMVEPGPALLYTAVRQVLQWHLQAVRCGQSLGPRLVPGAPE